MLAVQPRGHHGAQEELHGTTTEDNEVHQHKTNKKRQRGGDGYTYRTAVVVLALALRHKLTRVIGTQPRRSERETILSMAGKGQSHNKVVAQQGGPAVVPYITERALETTRWTTAATPTKLEAVTRTVVRQNSSALVSSYTIAMPNRRGHKCHKKKNHTLPPKSQVDHKYNAPTQHKCSPFTPPLHTINTSRKDPAPLPASHKMST